MWAERMNSGLSGRLYGLQSAFKSKPMKSPIIQFEGWSPDRAYLGLAGSPVAENVIPDEDGFRPFKAFASIAAVALDARCRGATIVRDSGQQVYIYAGDQTKLYDVRATVTTDVSKSGGYATAADDGVWEFTKFGTKLIATNYADAVQSITVGGANFADHFTSTLKPKFKHLAVVRNQLVGGASTDATDGEVLNRLWWSADGNSVDFDPAASTMCDFEDIADGGEVRRIVGGEYGVVFQDSQIKRMDFVGPPLIYEINTADQTRGAPIPGSVVALGRFVFYRTEDGFFYFDGATSNPIGNAKLDRYWWSNFDMVYRSRVTSAIDVTNKLVVWGHPNASATDGAPNQITMFHWPSGKFSYAEVDHEVLFNAASYGISLDESAVGEPASLDAVYYPESFDAEAWKGGALRLGAFNTSHIYGAFTGSNLAAVIETGESQPFRDSVARVTGIRPLVSNQGSAVSGTITAQVAPRMTQQEAQTYGSAGSLNSDGVCEVDELGRYHGVRLNIAAGASWSHAQGVEFQATEEGSI